MPELDFTVVITGQFDCPVLRLRRQRNDDIEKVILKIVKGFGIVAGKIKPDLIKDRNGESIRFTLTDTGRIDIIREPA